MKKKVLILSQAYLEGTTDYVCQWLDYYGVPFIRLNGEDFFNMKKLGDMPKNNEVAMVWYRRKAAKIPAHFSQKRESFETHYTLRRFLIDEFNALHSLLFYAIDKEKWLNDPIIASNLNKLKVLFLAQKFGLNIPYTEVLTDKQSLITLQDTYPELIVKPLSECVLLEDGNGAHYKMLSREINHSNIRSIPDIFFPSLVQQKIDKKFEVRAFYLSGRFYSMAIFSQANKKTASDFRNYDNKRPNRTVPYKLPDEIESRLDLLMKELNFGTGSIDLMVDHNDAYYFLEINPEGQFGMVSYPCNYYLEREMALLFKQKQLHEEKVQH
ncbi:grasp-with-spasm system ATP-grasp peptide maturase [Pedobacter sp. UBA5917]|jgi:ATP-GRASP peptide maturase of grasp-with-spasm system|uniref:grasp-with-spasm system ATP-grasp peptide maturase n=1 Tax=Pedobacter sp. UBA5917 TaxID=1947061 RepID=UPI0025CE4362|nr:grasp-with-spasm system ATP-grasp peptide maturase [Pedobacter sp. UBA5917]